MEYVGRESCEVSTMYFVVCWCVCVYYLRVSLALLLLLLLPRILSTFLLPSSSHPLSTLPTFLGRFKKKPKLLTVLPSSFLQLLQSFKAGLFRCSVFQAAQIVATVLKVQQEAERGSPDPAM